MKNYTHAIFLINSKVRAIRCNYDENDFSAVSIDPDLALNVLVAMSERLTKKLSDLGVEID